MNEKETNEYEQWSGKWVSTNINRGLLLTILIQHRATATLAMVPKESPSDPASSR